MSTRKDTPWPVAPFRFLCGADACDLSPARLPQCVTVAATDVSDTRWSGSNYGSCVDLYAPGVAITSAMCALGKMEIQERYDVCLQTLMSITSAMCALRRSLLVRGGTGNSIRRCACSTLHHHRARSKPLA